MIQNVHQPVLLEEIKENFKQKNKLKIFDGTFGGGSYSKSFLEDGHIVWACDRDKSIKPELFDVFFRKQNQNFKFQSTSFDTYIEEFIDNFFDVIVLDLGFSSNQLEFSGRGFSYQKLNEPLDLRYDDQNGKPCWKKIQNLNKPEQFFKILYKYSGEQLSPKLGKELVNLIRSKKNDDEVLVSEVVQTLALGIPGKYKKNGNSILSRIWQALRIWTNQEFMEIENFLPKALSKLKPGGRLMIVTFHSLEDKLVTHFMRQIAKPTEVDVFGNTEQKYKIIAKKGLRPSAQEIQNNPRSRSATLRILEKVDH